MSEETAQQVVAKAVAWLGKHTHSLGDGALGVVIGSEAYHAGMAKLNDAAISGDVEATKTAANDLARAVKTLTVEGDAHDPTAH